ncbi:MAG: ABC transporter permease [Solirubrobacterales bacterium]|nr:ABC transporter permease [Solirubrobacterales bacterium]
MRWLLGKDLTILKRSPLLTGILVLYPVILALMIGFALSSPPGKPKVAIYSGIHAGQANMRLGGAKIDVGSYTHQLLASIQPLPVKSSAAAVAAVRSGHASAAIIVPANLIDQVHQLLSQGVGQPSVRIVLNSRNPLERDLVDSQIQTRIDQVESAVSHQLLKAALTDMNQVVNGGPISFAGASVNLMGLKQARAIVARAAARTHDPGLSRVVSFANLAIGGMSLANPVLGQLQTPLAVQRQELAGASTPTAAYAVAIAAVVSEMFVALLLAAALLAAERSENVFSRLVRGLVSRTEIVAEKTLLAAALSALVTFVLACVISVFVPALSWGRVELWLAAALCAGLAFGALGVVLGALAREVAAASLLAFGVALPMAFIALIPSSAVSGALAGVLDVISFVFPFRAALEAVSNAFSGTSPAIGLPLVHLLVLALIFGGLARLLLRRFAA